MRKDPFVQTRLDLRLINRIEAYTAWRQALDGGPRLTTTAAVEHLIDAGLLAKLTETTTGRPTRDALLLAIDIALAGGADTPALPEQRWVQPAAHLAATLLQRAYPELLFQSWKHTRALVAKQHAKG